MRRFPARILGLTPTLLVLNALPAPHPVVVDTKAMHILTFPQMDSTVLLISPRHCRCVCPTGGPPPHTCVYSCVGVFLQEVSDHGSGPTCLLSYLGFRVFSIDIKSHPSSRWSSQGCSYPSLSPSSHFLWVASCCLCNVSGRILKASSTQDPIPGICMVVEVMCSGNGWSWIS